MREIYSLTKKLEECLVDSKHSITVKSAAFDSCSCRGLIENCLYIYIPHMGEKYYITQAQKLRQNRIKESQEKVKEHIKNYAKENKLEIVASKIKSCGSFECTGHYLDPFKEKADGEYIVMRDFPEDINGTHIYFLTPENMEILELIQSKLF